MTRASPTEASAMIGRHGERTWRVAVSPDSADHANNPTPTLPSLDGRLVEGEAVPEVVEQSCRQTLGENISELSCTGNMQDPQLS